MLERTRVIHDAITGVIIGVLVSQIVYWCYVVLIA